MKEAAEILGLFKKTVDRWARKTGLVIRRRAFKPYHFLLLMVIGQLGMKHPSLAGMVAALRADFSREALHKRFSPQAVAFMHMCLVFALKQKVKQGTSIDAKALRPFSRVMLLDSSAWNVHPSLEGVLPGTGGDGSGATCKLQAFYEYKKGELSFAETTTALYRTASTSTTSRSLSTKVTWRCSTWDTSSLRH